MKGYTMNELKAMKKSQLADIQCLHLLETIRDIHKERGESWPAADHQKLWDMDHKRLMRKTKERLFNDTVFMLKLNDRLYAEDGTKILYDNASGYSLFYY